MTVRSARFLVALLLSAPLATAANAQGLEYASGARKYRLSTSTKITQTAMGVPQSFELGVNELISVNVAKKTKDTLTATMTLDSIQLSAPMGPQDLSHLYGIAFIASISPTGTLYSAKAPENLEPEFAQLTDGIVRFLPSYRGSLKVGTTFTDTTAGKVNQQGLDVDRTVISSYKVSGDTTINSQRAVRVERTSTVKASGSGSMMGQPVTMQSSGKSVGTFYLTPTGVYLGAVSTDDVDVKITILAQNADFLIKQNGTTKVEAIR